MEIVKLAECGYCESLLGLRLSYALPAPTMPLYQYVNEYFPDETVAQRLKDCDRGHNKFLEAIETWWLIRAPLVWWQQFDQYRHAQEGLDESVTQSESTMHTLMKRPLAQSDFERPIAAAYLVTLNDWIMAEAFQAVSDGLPRAFLQVRQVKLNYQVLRNMLIQRESHKLQEWRIFCERVRAQVSHPDLLPEMPHHGNL